VKSLDSMAAGPAMRRAPRIDSSVPYSTIIRAGRSVRLQTMPESPVTSPLMVPYGICGRAASLVMTAGAVPCARIRKSPVGATTAAPRAVVLRKSLRFGDQVAMGSLVLLLGEGPR